MERLRPERSWSEIHASYDQKKCRSHPIHRKVRPTGLPAERLPALGLFAGLALTLPPNLRISDRSRSVGSMLNWTMTLTGFPVGWFRSSGTSLVSSATADTATASNKRNAELTFIGLSGKAAFCRSN